MTEIVKASLIFLSKITKREIKNALNNKKNMRNYKIIIKKKNKSGAFRHVHLEH